jgi:hypothetical protein
MDPPPLKVHHFTNISFFLSFLHLFSSLYIEVILYLPFRSPLRGYPLCRKKITNKSFHSPRKIQRTTTKMRSQLLIPLLRQILAVMLKRPMRMLTTRSKMILLQTLKRIRFPIMEESNNNKTTMLKVTRT